MAGHRRTASPDPGSSRGAGDRGEPRPRCARHQVAPTTDPGSARRTRRSESGRDQPSRTRARCRSLDRDVGRDRDGARPADRDRVQPGRRRSGASRRRAPRGARSWCSASPAPPAGRRRSRRRAIPPAPGTQRTSSCAATTGPPSWRRSGTGSTTSAPPFDRRTGSSRTPGGPRHEPDRSGSSSTPRPTARSSAATRRSFGRGFPDPRRPGSGPSRRAARHRRRPA